MNKEEINREEGAGKLIKGEEGRLLVLPDFKKFDLNLRQAKFCQMKSYGYSNTEAARAAGYSPSYCSTIGYSMMMNPKVVEYIQYLSATVAYSYGISKNMLIEELVNIKNLSIEEKKYASAIAAVKAIANMIGYDNGKNPEKEGVQNAPDKVNNFLINFTNALPEEKKKMLESEQINPSLDFQVLNDFQKEVKDDIVEDAMKRAKEEE